MPGSRPSSETFAFCGERGAGAEEGCSAKRGHVEGSPEDYVRGYLRRADSDATEMMGRTRAGSMAAYAEMTALNQRGAGLRASLGFGLKRVK